MTDEVRVKAVEPHRAVGLETLIRITRGRIDQEIDSTKGLFRFLNQLIDILVLAQVRQLKHSPLDRPRDGGTGFDLNIGEDHLGASASECLNKTCADPAGAAGDESDASRDSLHRFHPSTL